MPNLTVYVPDELKRAMDGLQLPRGWGQGWSRVVQLAIVAELRRRGVRDVPGVSGDRKEKRDA